MGLGCRERRRVAVRAEERRYGRVNQTVMHGRFWSPPYVAGSCGGAPLQVVKDYIAQQKRPD
ncbi:transposase [Streptomyces cellulosae]